MKAKTLPLVLLCIALAIAKLEAQNLVWANQFKSTSAAPGTGVSGRLIAAYDGGTVVGMNLYPFYDDSIDINPQGTPLVEGSLGGNDFILAKYSTTGALLWHREFGAPGSQQLYTITEHSSDHHIFIAGAYTASFDADPGSGTVYMPSPGTNIQYAFLIELDQDGNYVWSAAFPSTSNNCYITQIAFNSLDYLVLAGEFTGSMDADASAATQTLTAATGEYDVFITMYSPSHNMAWARTLGSSYSVYLSDMAIDHNNNILFTGTFDHQVDFNPGPGVNNITPVGNFDIYLCKFDYQGNYVNAFSLGGTGSDYAGRIMPYYGGFILTGSTSSPTIDLDPGTGTDIVGTTGITKSFMVNYDDNYNVLWTDALEGVGIISLDIYDAEITTLIQAGSTFDADPNPPVVNVPIGQAGAEAFVTYNFSDGYYKRYLSFDTAHYSGIQNFAHSGDNLYMFASYGNGFNADVNGNNGILHTLNNSSAYVANALIKYDNLAVEPSIQASNIQFIAGNDTTVTVTLTKGNGEKRIVLVSLDLPVTTDPSDAIYYGGDTVFGQGPMLDSTTFAVYLDTGNTFTLTGIDTVGHSYYFKAYEMNGVSSTINFLLPNAPTAVYEGKNLTSGITETTNNKLQLYPNPAHQQVMLHSSITLDETDEIKVMDINGRTVMVVSGLRNTLQQIDVSALTPGLYVMQLMHQNTQQSLRFIKQ